MHSKTRATNPRLDAVFHIPRLNGLDGGMLQQLVRQCSI